VKTAVAIVGMGDMGAAVGKRLVERGARVLTSLEGRSRASAERAATAGVEVMDDCELVRQSDFILSIVPPSCASEFAARMLAQIRAAERKPVFVDCNAVCPATVKEIAAPFEVDQLPFVDAGILGPPPGQGRGPRIHASGIAAARFAELGQFGLNIKVLSDGLGDASALKMCFGGVTKGLQALGAAIMLGSMRNGVSKALREQMEEVEPGVSEMLFRLIPKCYSKAYRWVGEMEEISKFLEPEIGGAEMFGGAAHFFSDLTVDYEKGSNTGRVALLNEFLGQSEAQEAVE
jgi:L-threonate 2-dehydrogenase